MQRLVPVLFSVCLLCPTFAFAQKPTPKQLIVQSAAVDHASGFIVIEGQHFGNAAPAVTLEGEPLAVHASSDSHIEAIPPGDVAAGSYLLVVSRGPSSNDISSFIVTMGAVGPRGEVGPQGPKGEQGLPGVTPAEITAITSFIEEMQASLAAHTTRLNDLTAQLAQANAQIDALQAQNNTQQAQLNSHQSQISAQQTQINQARADVNQLFANDHSFSAVLSQWWNALEAWRGGHFLVQQGMQGNAHVRFD